MSLSCCVFYLIFSVGILQVEGSNAVCGLGQNFQCVVNDQNICEEDNEDG